mgnify:CR=1 FL=1
MILLPAIDLYEKKAVRLLKGDYRRMTVYSENSIEIAHDFEKQGAEYIHVVDLEGAKDGTTPNLAVVRQIAKETGLFIEVGGGVRDMETVERYFDCGVSRVILGTAAVTDEEFLAEALDRYAEKIAVGADVKDGCIAIKGWLEQSSYSLSAFLDKVQQMGVKNVICTDISKDGAMRGTNLAMYRELAEKYALDITASGGVSSLEDIRHLRRMGLYGAIIGKAYYTGAVNLKEAIEVAR